VGHQLPGRPDPASAGHDLFAPIDPLCLVSALFGWFVVTNAVALGITGHDKLLPK
jgi:hypothetical protein